MLPLPIPYSVRFIPPKDSNAFTDLLQHRIDYRNDKIPERIMRQLKEASLVHTGSGRAPDLTARVKGIVDEIVSSPPCRRPYHAWPSSSYNIAHSGRMRLTCALPSSEHILLTPGHVLPSDSHTIDHTFYFLLIKCIPLQRHSQC